mmetsp:Transcript_14966/g.25558  ORF Transcript_14966/g.25558 Transcript_14966/m.25558 type:complete len:401 (-) Transcript_14966:535-1737(-)
MLPLSLRCADDNEDCAVGRTLALEDRDAKVRANVLVHVLGVGSTKRGARAAQRMEVMDHFEHGIVEGGAGPVKRMAHVGVPPAVLGGLSAHEQRWNAGRAYVGGVEHAGHGGRAPVLPAAQQLNRVPVHAHTVEAIHVAPAFGEVAHVVVVAEHGLDALLRRGQAGRAVEHAAQVCEGTRPLHQERQGIHPRGRRPQTAEAAGHCGGERFVARHLAEYVFVGIARLDHAGELGCERGWQLLGATDAHAIGAVVVKAARNRGQHIVLHFGATHPKQPHRGSRVNRQWRRVKVDAAVAVGAVKVPQGVVGGGAVGDDEIENGSEAARMALIDELGKVTRAAVLWVERHQLPRLAAPQVHTLIEGEDGEGVAADGILNVVELLHNLLQHCPRVFLEPALAVYE